VAQMLFIVAGLVYLLIGIFNCLAAIFLRRIDLPPLAIYPTPFSEEDMEQAKREAFSLKGDLRFDIVLWAAVLNDLNKAFNTIKKVAREFNKATKLNRIVLCFAAASLFVAAFFSFAQGFS
jgi:hypothetical protein